MELQQLRYLRAVVRTGSVTAAAEMEYVAQPSVSKQMKQLERELGVPLLHRVGRRVQPTEAAIALADMAERIFDDISATVAAITAPGDGAGSTLRVAATETVTDHLLPNVLAKWSERYPKARITIEMLSTDAAVQEVLDGDADFAVVVLPLTDARLQVHPLLEEEVLLAVGRQHPWVHRPFVPVAEALESPGLLLSMRGRGLRALAEQTAAARGVQISGTVEIRSQQALLAMVARGAGVSLAPAMALDERPDVCGVPLEPRLLRHVGWAVRKGRHLSAVAAAFLALLEAETAPQVPEPDASAAN